MNETKRHLQCGRDGAAQMPLLCVRDREESEKIDRKVCEINKMFNFER